MEKVPSATFAPPGDYGKGEALARSNSQVSTTAAMQVRSRLSMRSLARALPRLSKCKRGTKGTTKSSGSAKNAWRFEGENRGLKSLFEFGRLRTLAKALNWLAPRSSTSFPRPRVPV